MAFKIIKKGYMADGYTKPNVMEVLIDSPGDVASLPKECDPGSCAYTADLSHIFQLSVTGEWIEIK